MLSLGQCGFGLIERCFGFLGFFILLELAAVVLEISAFGRQAGPVGHGDVGLGLCSAAAVHSKSAHHAAALAAECAESASHAHAAALAAEVTLNTTAWIHRSPGSFGREWIPQPAATAGRESTATTTAATAKSGTGNWGIGSFRRRRDLGLRLSEANDRQLRLRHNQVTGVGRGDAVLLGQRHDRLNQLLVLAAGADLVQQKADLPPRPDDFHHVALLAGL